MFGREKKRERLKEKETERKLFLRLDSREEKANTRVSFEYPTREMPADGFARCRRKSFDGFGSEL